MGSASLDLACKIAMQDSSLKQSVILWVEDIRVTRSSHMCLSNKGWDIFGLFVVVAGNIKTAEAISPTACLTLFWPQWWPDADAEEKVQEACNTSLEDAAFHRNLRFEEMWEQHQASYWPWTSPRNLCTPSPVNSCSLWVQFHFAGLGWCRTRLPTVMVAPLAPFFPPFPQYLLCALLFLCAWPQGWVREPADSAKTNPAVTNRRVF